jgi:signal transduction histidine kinase
MLDDFGLQAALEWHVRDLARRYSLPVDLDVEGQLDDLPDQYRTCVYRIVQEALTNSVRHADAKRVRVHVLGGPDILTVVVADDGVGFDRTQHLPGLGLRGMEERVREIGGTITIQSPPTGGTTLEVRLPLPTPTMEASLARAAG